VEEKNNRSTQKNIMNDNRLVSRRWMEQPMDACLYSRSNYDWGKV